MDDRPRNQEQLLLPFPPAKETQAERCQRILSNDRLKAKVATADVMFDYDRATARARQLEARTNQTRAGYVSPANL